MKTKIKNYEPISLEDKLINKIMVYYSTIWKDKLEEGAHKLWLSNFSNDKQKINALYLLSKFMYFGNTELRELLKSLYRDLYKNPIIQSIRKNNNDSKDLNLINTLFNNELTKTKFLGIGNPSESGVHLLYYFRQENKLSKKHFINTHEIFDSRQVKNKDTNSTSREYYETVIKDNDIKRYIFIDDVCGGGSQAIL